MWSLVLQLDASTAAHLGPVNGVYSGSTCNVIKAVCRSSLAYQHILLIQQTN